MILFDIPKVTRIPLVETKEIPLSNFRAVTFLIETAKAGEQITLTVEGNTEGGTAKAIPFLLKRNGEEVYEEAAAEGRHITHEGDEPIAWLVTVTADMLAHDELDRVALKITGATAESVTTVYAFQTEPRYTDRHE